MLRNSNLMSTKLELYHSIDELTAKLDKRIAETKSNLGIYLRKLDEIRILAERSKKIRDTVLKLTGNKVNSNPEELELNGVKVISNAKKMDEMEIIELTIRSKQEYLIRLQKARENLKPLEELQGTEGLSILVFEKNGLPNQVLLKFVACSSIF